MNFRIGIQLWRELMSFLEISIILPFSYIYIYCEGRRRINSFLTLILPGCLLVNFSKIHCSWSHMWRRALSDWQVLSYFHLTKFRFGLITDILDNFEEIKKNDSLIFFSHKLLSWTFFFFSFCIFLNIPVGTDSQW